jgi:hypothetical protein
MRSRQRTTLGLAIALSVSLACSAPPGQRPIKLGPVDSGPGTLTAARMFLQGTWVLESFEVRLPNRPPVMLKGEGMLIYDDRSNLKMHIRADEASADILRANGVDIRDGEIRTDGRAVLDLQHHLLTYVLEGQAPLIPGPLGTNHPRHWTVEGDLLVLTTKDDAGETTSTGRWRRHQ